MIQAVAGGRDARALAEARQAAASDPAASVFVSASAGSGKTKLLIDRLLRLMLPRSGGPPGGASGGRDGVIAGSAPSRILCLTYTKAAAAEMAIRLNQRLGRWVTLADPALDAELRGLDAQQGPAGRAAARALFAQVLDQPGGMRIQTIHAFCQSLLRRFPLEAAMSPHFRLIEGSESRRGLHAALDAVLHPAAPELAQAVADLAVQADLAGIRALLALLRTAEAQLAPAFALHGRDAGAFEAALARALDLAGSDRDALLADAVTPPGEALLVDRLRLVAGRGSKAVAARAATALDFLSAPPAERAARWTVWRDLWLTGRQQPRASSQLVNDKLADLHDGLAASLLSEAERVARAHLALVAVETVRLTGLLLALGRPALLGHRTAKQGQGAVEFDDLISRTLDLLAEPGAAWVLFKLDGGLDHVLLDEVQDTAPAQWLIAERLTEEFFAGDGQHADAPPRTIFAVGDYKQSIFGFQGARPQAFHEVRDRFAARVRAAGGIWRTPELVVSFRSTASVLELVDLVFDDPLARQGLAEGGVAARAGEAGQVAAIPRHVAHRTGPGRLELWPLAVPMPTAEAASPPGPGLDGPWQVPRDNAHILPPVQMLADALADWIEARIGRPAGQGEPLLPGDVLVLVRRRSALDRLLPRALKRRGIAVANLLSAGLLDRVAVQDLLALCDALLLPADDLAVACVLTSPLGGLSDDSLMELAMTRPLMHSGRQTLWQALATRAGERPDWRAASDFLAALFSRVDLDPPYALLSEALGRLGGRARLLARLGSEAADAVDELLATALAWSAAHPPSLQSFVHWVREAAVETRAEPDPAGQAVRLMTVHGAKGLQARLVVLADTVAMPRREESTLLWPQAVAPRGDVAAGGWDSGWESDGGAAARDTLPLWVPRKADHGLAAQALAERGRQLAIEEYNRLLYVALTRAEDELLVCGWTGLTAVDPRCWYERVAAAFAALPRVRQEPFGPWAGDRMCRVDPGWPDPAAAPVAIGPRAGWSAAGPVLPDWLGRAPDWRPAPPPAEPRLPQPLAPSRPTEIAFGPAPLALSPLLLSARRGGEAPAGRADRASARLRGTVVHTLLQYLPELPPERRRDAALAYVARFGSDPGGPAPIGEASVDEALVDEALGVIDTPGLAPLFGPGSRAEQALAGRVGDLAIAGQVDRLAITPELAIVADFKTGRLPPSRLDEVPVAYVRQMAAYRALLAAIYPQRRVLCVLVWTAGPEAMLLPDALLDLHAPHAQPD